MRPWTPVKIKIILINENEMTNKQEIWHSGLVNDYTINFIKFFNKQIKFLNKGVRFQTYLCQLNDFPSWAENRRSIFGGHISLDRYPTYVGYMSALCPQYILLRFSALLLKSLLWIRTCFLWFHGKITSIQFHYPPLRICR